MRIAPDGFRFSFLRGQEIIVGAHAVSGVVLNGEPVISATARNVTVPAGVPAVLDDTVAVIVTL
jgi:hypothetical protein